jgi:predicted Zn-dependent protease
MFVTLCAVALFAQSVDVDKRIGAEAAEQVLQSRGLYENKQLSAFLEKLGARLVDQLGPQPFTYRFAISDEQEPNAYALPGGYIFATRTLFAVANSEDELAGVLGHEIIHAHRRHSVRSVKRSILPGVLAIPGNLAGIFSKQAGGILTAPSSLMMAGHSRKDEREADDRGIQLAAQAGYDPRALASFLNRLTTTVEIFSGEKERASYFDSHPSTPARLDAIEKRAASLERAKTEPILRGRDAYVKMLDGLTIGQNPQQGIFEKNVFVHPEMNFRMELPEGWKTVNTPAVFGAREANGRGQIVIGLGDKAKSPEDAGSQAVEAIAKEAKRQPAESRKVDVNGHPGYYARFEDRRANMHLLWVALGGQVFRMAGAADEEGKEALRKSAFSLRMLRADERSNVRVLLMRLEPARANESVKAFCERTKSHFKPELIAVLNDLVDKPLARGQLVKVVRWEPYSPPQ